jgi:hypothetical protein
VVRAEKSHDNSPFEEGRKAVLGMCAPDTDRSENVYFSLFLFLFLVDSASAREHVMKISPGLVFDINNSAQSLIASLTSSAPFSSDLEELQNILHFPEEVALRLTDAEYQLYYQVRRQHFLLRTFCCLPFSSI